MPVSAMWREIEPAHVSGHHHVAEQQVERLSLGNDVERLQCAQIDRPHLTAVLECAARLCNRANIERPAQRDGITAGING